MKKLCLCMFLIFVLLFTGCKAPVTPSSDAGDDDVPDEPYVKQYPYPEGVEYMAYFSTVMADGGMHREGIKVFRLSWTVVDDVPDGMLWTMETETALAIAKAYAEDAYMHYLVDRSNTLTFFEVDNPRLILTEDARLAMLFDMEVKMSTKMPMGRSDLGEILIFDTSEEPEPYVRQYAYPEGVEYTAFFTTQVADGGMHREGTKVYRGEWDFASEVPDGMSWTMENDTVLAIAKAYAEDAYMHYLVDPANSLTFEFSNPRLILTTDARLALLVEVEVDMATKDGLGYMGRSDLGEILVFDTAGVTEPYVRQYAYPEGVAYTAFFGPKVALGGMHREGIEVYTMEWTVVDDVPDGMSWTMETETALAIAKAYTEDAYMHYLEDSANSLIFTFTNPRFVLTEDEKLAMIVEMEVEMRTKKGQGYMISSDGGDILIFDVAGVTDPSAAT